MQDVPGAMQLLACSSWDWLVLLAQHSGWQRVCGVRGLGRQGP